MVLEKASHQKSSRMIVKIGRKVRKPNAIVRIFLTTPEWLGPWTAILDVEFCSPKLIGGRRWDYGERKWEANCVAVAHSR
jgi:hypothetical protein